MRERPSDDQERRHEKADMNFGSLPSPLFLSRIRPAPMGAATVSNLSSTVKGLDLENFWNSLSFNLIDGGH